MEALLGLYSVFYQFSQFHNSVRILTRKPYTTVTPYTPPPSFPHFLVKIPESMNIRLVNGTNSTRLYSGRVEVRNAPGNWGTVSDNQFDDDDASVICRMFGYQRGIARNGAYFGRGTGETFMDYVDCIGNEESFFACHYHQRGWGYHYGNRDHSRDAGVKCSSDA